MNRAKAIPVAAGDHVVGYPVPVASAPGRRKPPSRKRKAGFPGFRIRMKDFYRDYVRAAAECTGWDSCQFCYNAILRAVWDAERQLGISAEGMVKLSKSQRTELANKVRLVAGAAWPSRQMTKPTTN